MWKCELNKLFSELLLVMVFEHSTRNLNPVLTATVRLGPTDQAAGFLACTLLQVHRAPSLW